MTHWRGLLVLASMLAWAALAGATEAVGDGAEDDTAASWDELSEGLDDLDALERLEVEMLDDLVLRLPAAHAIGGPYEGMAPLSGSPGLRTVVDVPRVERRASSASLSLIGTDAGRLELREVPDDAPLRAAVERVDLASLPPLFGLDTLDYEPIHHYVDFYMGPGRRRLARLLARSGRYAELLRGELRAAGLPEELLYLVMIESGFDPCPRSHAGAVGLWQFMPATGRSYGLEIDRRYDERCDPEASTRAALEYLSSLYERFGSWPLAMAGYNAGGGHVRGELRRYNLNDFWRMDDYSAVYDDTRRYVYRIIAAAVIGENQERFGFEGVVPESALRWETVDVPGRTRLAVFASAAGVDVDELQRLNPALRVASTPEVATYRLHLPEGTLARFVARYDDYVAGDEGRTFVHTVRVGERLGHLAELFGLPERVLRAANGLERGAQPPYGSELVIPLDPDRAADLLARLPGPPPDEADRRIAVIPALEFRYGDRQRVFYPVQAGDDLRVVAPAFGVTVWDLAMWNDLDPDAVLHADMMLQVFVAPGADLAGVRYLPEDHVRPLALGSAEFAAWDQGEERARRSARRTYTVRRGDTLGTIARRFGVSSRDLMRWNGLDSAGRIRTGQQLRVR
jgi:membrane-bound lytic murein transglycosylase D